ncbi:MAG: hypothetical protein ABSB40_11845 [Nitrososphaeria archaeon]|jgi:hypothetical protein
MPYEINQNGIKDELRFTEETGSSESESSIDGLIFQAIDEALSILGNKSRESIYYFLESEHGLSKEEIPSNLKRFHEALRMIFGAGAYVLEKHIRSCLEKKFGTYIPLIKDQDLIEFVVEIEKINRKGGV